jgi:hypothetical protein
VKNDETPFVSPTNNSTEKLNSQLAMDNIAKSNYPTKKFSSIRTTRMLSIAKSNCHLVFLLQKKVEVFQLLVDFC